MKKASIETIGCDIGDRESEVFVLGISGKCSRARVKTTKAGMRLYFDRPAAHVVIEVGAHSRWIAALLKSLGHKVTVANARRLRLISESDSKSDRSDAELLARLGRADIGLLSEVHHRSEKSQSDLAVPKTRDVLVSTRTKLVNHVRSVVKSFGERLPTSTAESFAKKTRALIPTVLRAALEPLYDALTSIDDQIKRLDRTITSIAKRYPDVEILSQPHGVGTLTALVYLLVIENKKRFSNSRTVGAFVGMRPRRDQSGGSDPQLRITKAGDPFLRRLLVNCANHILGPFGKDSDLRRWGLALAERGGKNGRKRAKVAVARKLAVLMHSLWMTGEVYEPIRAKAA